MSDRARFRRLCQVSAAVAVKFDLVGLPWSPSGPPVCGDCGRKFEGEQDQVKEVPILFWKNSGDLMLALCSPCATRRYLV